MSAKHLEGFHRVTEECMKTNYFPTDVVVKVSGFSVEEKNLFERNFFG